MAQDSKSTGQLPRSTSLLEGLDEVDQGAVRIDVAHRSI